METLLYLLGGVIVLVLLYKSIVRSNRKTMENGREYVNAHPNIDAFLNRPAGTLTTDEEIAALNFLVLKPWRETRNHFAPLISVFEKSYQLDDEISLSITRMTVAMGVRPTLVMLAKTVPLPVSVGFIASAAFSRWTDEYKQSLEHSPNRTVRSFYSESSSAAVAAIFSIPAGQMAASIYRSDSSVQPTKDSKQRVDAAGVDVGMCPNCDKTIPLVARKCAHCNASFVNAAWRVRPLS